MSKTTTPRDFFLHLLHIVALYGSSFALLAVLWQLINLGFPDPTEGGYRIFQTNSTIRWGIAFLVVMFPVLLGTGRFLEKVYKKEPEKRELKIRKWLVYFTLFVTAIVIIVDLIRLIFEFLEGEITPRFILKFASVLGVAGAIFWYYLQNIKEQAPKLKKLFVWKIIVIVIVTVVAGFILVDSPADERAYKRDDRRVEDLQIVQSHVLEAWRENKALPSSIEALDIKPKDPGFDPTRDPETGELYTYEKRGAMTFALCATFEREARGKGEDFYPRPERLPVPFDKEGMTEYQIKNSSWDHEAGETCFEREIIVVQ